MKLRIRDNSIRLRLSKGEVAAFAENGIIESRTNLAGGDLVYALRAAAQPDLSADFANGRIEIVVPEPTARKWAETDEVGIEGTAGKVSILIEKDFKCLTPRAGEDESDTFPNPAEGKC
jgi:hypothetical protein